MFRTIETQSRKEELMCEQRWINRSAGWLALAFGLAYVPWAAGNGGPFVIKYPGGDPAAKGVLAKIDPDLKPGREERLRVLKEDLKVLFIKNPMETLPPAPISTPGSKGSPSTSTWLDLQPPLALVSAIYTIENPTDEPIEVEFGFPILRGIYVHPFSMMPVPDARVKIDTKEIRPDLISNSLIYGIIRQRAQEAIDKALAADPELAQLVARVRTTSYVRQRARDALEQLTVDREVLLKAVQTDPKLKSLIAVKSDAADPDRAAARQELMHYLTGRMKWDKGSATLMVEYASLELNQLVTSPHDARYGLGWGGTGEMGRLGYANMGRLAVIGEQKTTQLFAELASRFDPGVKTAYEAIFSAWGGDVRERSVDFETGQVRPRELTLDPKRSPDSLARLGAADPTIYARMDYINPHAGLSEGEKASCEAVLKNLPVTFTFAPMNLLHYKASFPARGTRTLTVSYKQYAYADTGEPASYQLAYVVHPASMWKEFGPIELEVAVPEGLQMKSSVGCNEAGTEERELPKEVIPGITPEKAKVKVAVYRATVTDKTGELFLAIDAQGWNKLTERKAKVAVNSKLGAPASLPASARAGRR